MNEREYAVSILMEIFNENAYNNLILKREFKKNKLLTDVQKAFITELVNGTVRNLILIDYIINQFSKTNTKKMKPLILNLLRVGVYQIYFMAKIPHSAACNEAVKIAKKRGFHNLSGFVNGILRNISRNVDNIKFPKEGTREYLEVKYSYPEWIIDYWLKEFSYDELEKNLISLNKVPKVSVCINNIKKNVEDILPLLPNPTKAPFTDNLYYISKTSDISENKAFKEGLFHIMDASSALCVKIADPKEDTQILDICSAPGGKSFYTAYLTKDNAKITSRDIYPHKIDLIDEGKTRLNLKSIETQIKDAEVEYKEDFDRYDTVLCDVPCSGLGLLRKKPDIKYNKSMEDIDSLVKIQRNILSISSKYVKIKGVLVYSTCTLSKKENEDNIKWFLENYDYELCDIDFYLPEDLRKNNGYVKILPHLYDTDGFFVAKLRRIK